MSSENLTIHTYRKAWKNAELVGVGFDDLYQCRRVLLVRHPDFAGGKSAGFYAQAEPDGRHLNVGNGAYWLTRR